MSSDSSDNPLHRQTGIFPGRILVGEDPLPLPVPDYREEEGAIFRFLGVVRRNEGGRPLLGIRYSHYPAMLEKAGQAVIAEAREKFPPHRLYFYHRLGFVAVGTPSILIEVRAGHSPDAFAIGGFYLNQAKTVLPIWKEPVFSPSPDFP